MSPEQFRETYATIEPTEKGCRLWPGQQEGSYPIFKEAGKSIRGNRYALAIKLGRPILPKLFACHTCDQPQCLAFEHLYEGTHKQNCEDVKNRHRGSFGLLNGKHTKPQSRSFGSKNGTHTHPERVRRGELHPHTKLNQGKAEQIKSLKGKKTYKELSALFGVSPSSIKRVLNNRHWAG